MMVEWLIFFDIDGIWWAITAAEVFARAKELAGMGLAVPQAARLALLLGARGLPVPPEAAQPEALTAWLLARWRERGAAG